MKFEWTKTELKRTFYDQNNFNGKTVNNENVFSFNPNENTFSKQGYGFC